MLSCKSTNTTEGKKNLEFVMMDNLRTSSSDFFMFFDRFIKEVDKSMPKIKKLRIKKNTSKDVHENEDLRLKQKDSK